MKTSDFFVLVDLDRKEVIGKIQKLPENWMNIAGLPSIPKEELENLEWAGHASLGWFKLDSCKIPSLICSDENLELNKRTLKFLVGQERKKLENYKLSYKGLMLSADLKTRMGLFLKLHGKGRKELGEVFIKGRDSIKAFDADELEKVHSYVVGFIDSLDSWESSLHQKIDKAKDLRNLLLIDTSFSSKHDLL